VEAGLDIERPDALLRYLREIGRVAHNETPQIIALPGGVSNRTVLVERPSGEAWVIKQALAKLRVKEDWFSAPERVHREALGLRWLARLAPPGSITPFVFEDHLHHLVAMQAVPQPHENWKTRLLAGGLDLSHVTQFAHLLGTVHRRACEQAEVAAAFGDRTFFETLRLEPYYHFTAQRQSAAAGFLEELIAETMATRLTLVHGDYSPKNILIHQGRLVLLDHEVIHFGDPAFDLGFSLTHLLSKAHHLPEHRAPFLDAAQSYWRAYRHAAGELADLAGLEARATRHTLACLLARVDGRSPLEYLTEAERTRQREAVLRLMRAAPARLGELPEAFDREISR
jgi:aminoglycoside phosphotransferase (APT) family kinase protein